MKKTLATIAALTFTGAAVAQGAGFAELDADQNGALTYAEVTAAMPNMTMEAFAAADTDGNGTLSEEEFTAVVSKTDG
ncbi:EF-hand domain-containing protein [Stappia sp. ES.058]|uniref:EF-hand domain-containing protein n=1 Tax=Stappia sp. ES.058 TaxID=1881061 RepID=UPI000879EB7F|nr:EF-hand domain-containing protein [Stappia sp. ES.058]SDT92358.1 EF hand domain-containing protein [Stappia sp. ES.058]